MATNWKNNDGLYVLYGTNQATPSIAGEYRHNGPEHVVEAVIDLTTLTSSATVQDYAFRFPKTAWISRVDVIADTAATSGGSATLDIGIQRSDLSTEEDYNGLVAALAKTAIDAAGETNKITAGGTGAGALIGTALASTAASGYLTANYNTASFTAGKVRVRIYYYYKTATA